MEISKKYFNLLFRQFSQIHSGGWPIFYGKVIRSIVILFTILSVPWAIPSVLLIRSLRPWRTIRLASISPVHQEAIGHFVIDLGIHWAMRQSDKSYIRYFDLYYFDPAYAHKVCNQFWVEMVQRNFAIYPWFLLKPLDAWNKWLPGGTIHSLAMPLNTTGSRDKYGWLEKVQGSMPFLLEEDAKAKTWLRRQGWQEGDPFVCLLVRDSAYKGMQGIQGRVFARNSDINHYVAAAEWLAEQGVWVIRMGKNMAKPMPTQYHRIIDYAFHPNKSDFLDIWLFAHCDLCISTGSGPDCISDIYRRPMLLLNLTIPEQCYTWSNAMHLLKPLLWHESGKALTLREYLDHNWWAQGVDSGYYARAGIKLLELSSEEILAAVQERWQRIQRTWVETEADRKRQHRFLSVLKEHPNFIKYNDWIHPEFRVGTTWLRSMGEDFLV
jgi:putative glycosyltransferase (TIGR04372 family)